MPTATKIILLADDDLDDQELLEEALLQYDETLEVHTVGNARQALQYLQNCTPAEKPCLIILDYNMPDFNGAELLQLLGTNDLYKKIPAVVWSTSNSEFHKKLCEQNGARYYFYKPLNLAGIKEVAKQMLAFCAADTVVSK